MATGALPPLRSRMAALPPDLVLPPVAHATDSGRDAAVVQRLLAAPAAPIRLGQLDVDTLVVDRENFPEHIEPEVGQQLELSQSGQSFTVTVSEVTDDSVTLDANPPLAGKDLMFELELVEIV